MLHANGDWGDLAPEDAETNNQVVRKVMVADFILFTNCKTIKLFGLLHQAMVLLKTTWT